MSSPAVYADEVNTDDYPPGRAATVEELQQYCSLQNNPDQQAQLLSLTKSEEYPFEIIFCQQGTVAPYKCQTLLNLMNSEFNFVSLLREDGFKTQSQNVNQFKMLYPVYDQHCLSFVN
ncbi:MAG: hypothetical protein AAF549_06300 [Pseudomonadota bacterium]